jgi:hypothetical protein
VTATFNTRGLVQLGASLITVIAMKSETSLNSLLRRFGALLFVAILLVGPAAAQQSADVPLSVVDGQLGPCFAEFHVTDAAGKPQYNMPIHVLIRYGFLGKRKMDLEVGTNSDGKARVAGLPEQVRSPLHFEVGRGDAKQVVEHDPATNCHAYFDETTKH